MQSLIISVASSCSILFETYLSKSISSFLVILMKVLRIDAFLVLEKVPHWYSSFTSNVVLNFIGCFFYFPAAFSCYYWDLLILFAE
ncbi:unnamed protein product [Amoebophrya sp. A25]|nr:unnamed protein product [Amoebophrya sp. A25]|eukprot:GSA25T00021548001.1